MRKLCSCLGYNDVRGTIGANLRLEKGFIVLQAILMLRSLSLFLIVCDTSRSLPSVALEKSISKGTTLYRVYVWGAYLIGDIDIGGREVSHLFFAKQVVER